MFETAELIFAVTLTPESEVETSPEGVRDKKYVKYNTGIETRDLKVAKIDFHINVGENSKLRHLKERAKFKKNQ